MLKEVTNFWKNTYKKELDSITDKLAANTAEVRVFNNFSEEKVIKSAKYYVNHELTTEAENKEAQPKK
ncbi:MULTISPECIES: hypothetical protein [Acinetobacter]|uniref:hypothetical protein n=1 Tax=Acinetobacter TaxID=469 RepID=UPI001901DC15|nr:hypothetical protein [Acinetobacter bereziniae]MBJ8554222.1 hypothetical protein [Acinetobacter bereziniae]